MCILCIIIFLNGILNVSLYDDHGKNTSTLIRERWKWKKIARKITKILPVETFSYADFIDALAAGTRQTLEEEKNCQSYSIFTYK